MWGMGLVLDKTKNGVVYNSLGKPLQIGNRVAPSTMAMVQKRVLESALDDKFMRFPEKGDELMLIEVGSIPDLKPRMGNPVGSKPQTDAQVRLFFQFV